MLAYDAFNSVSYLSLETELWIKKQYLQYM